MPFAPRVPSVLARLAWIAAVPALGACGLSGDVGEPTAGQAASAIFGGTRDQASASVVAIRVGTGASYSICTGAAVAPNVVLTARHCTSVAATSTIGCDENGQSTNGDHVASDRPATDLRIFTGPAPNLDGTPAAIGKQVFRPPTKILCNADVALVVLDRALPGVVPLAVRTSGRPTPGETLQAVGYGRNDQGFPSGTRYARDVTVLAVGAAVTASGFRIANGEFEVGQGPCEGDSGGPALSKRTGAIVGVATRGVADCTAKTGHAYVEPAAFERLFTEAFAAAGAMLVVEPGGGAPPTPAPTSTVSGPGGGDMQSGRGGCGVAPADDGRPSRAALAAWTALALAGLVLRRTKR
jgi:MYXO-CTERM domain-containing protein